jgi:anti-anti-sigma factor
MQIEWEDKDTYYLGKVKGEFSFENEEYFLRQIHEKIQGSTKDKGFVLDFSELKFINSSGISVFENVYKFLKEKNREVKFINLPPKIKEIFFFLNVPFKKIIEV